MKKRILVLDMGGTSVKAALYQGDVVEEETRWEHDYKDCGLEKAKENLVSMIKDFCDCKIDAIGLSVAGLIATDNSLYRSTVVTSFQGFSIPAFLKQQLSVDVVTIDNDADCGAIGESQECRGRFFYVVVGSGIGSSYVDHDGNLPYLTRFDPKHEFSDNDNPIPNDLGLQLAISKSYIYAKFKELGVNREEVDKVLVNRYGIPLRGPNDYVNSVRVGMLGSSRGLKNIIDVLLTADYLEEHYQNEIESHSYFRNGGVDIKDISNEKRAAKILSLFACHGEYYATEAFKLFGHFLGYAVAEAEKIIRSEQSLHDSLSVRLAGAIMDSYDIFKKETIFATCERGADCNIKLAKNTSSNVYGAYLKAAKTLEQNK